jgi:hypothetical protein
MSDIHAPTRVIVISRISGQAAISNVGRCRMGQWGYQRFQKISRKVLMFLDEKKLVTVSIGREDDLQSGRNNSQILFSRSPGTLIPTFCDSISALLIVLFVSSN